MKYIISLCLTVFCLTSFSQPTEQVTTIDYVQVLNDNREETLFYYQNNWKLLRAQAVEKSYIDSFQLLETPYSEEAPFHFILVTTYANQAQYEKREDNFGELIEAKGPLRLLNDKQPTDFRKIIFSKDLVKHWN